MGKLDHLESQTRSSDFYGFGFRLQFPLRWLLDVSSSLSMLQTLLNFKFPRINNFLNSDMNLQNLEYREQTGLSGFSSHVKFGHHHLSYVKMSKIIVLPFLQCLHPPIHQPPRHHIATS
jgi:hypothetical protein